MGFAVTWICSVAFILSCVCHMLLLYVFFPLSFLPVCDTPLYMLVIIQSNSVNQANYFTVNYWSMGTVPAIKSTNKINNIYSMNNQSVPGHRKCPWAQSSGLERVLQGEQGSPGPSSLSTATGPAPKISYLSCNEVHETVLQAGCNAGIYSKFISCCKTHFMSPSVISYLSRFSHLRLCDMIINSSHPLLWQEWPSNYNEHNTEVTSLD